MHLFCSSTLTKLGFCFLLGSSFFFLKGFWVGKERTKMGRSRVELKRIENKISRRVTFSKRRSGLTKKAREISVLCDAKVALIVFSTKGNLFEYSTESSMERILEQYESYSYTEKQLVATDSGPQGSWALEYPKLVSRIEVLQRNIRHFTGEDLDPVSLRELQNLEQQLDTALRRVRTRKNHLMNEFISEFQKKEKSLEEENNLLSKKLKENEKTLTEGMHWQQQNQGQNSSTSMLPPPHQALSLPSLTIGEIFQAKGAVTKEIGAQTQGTMNTIIPSWMLHHANQ
ncbi:hypothetical protein L1049_002846 [Liquidambar formosana]|uniref:Uncharacterized protein n=1 Tax=Liquidambar formosana TaxID=63359 RepID=A0AAP0R968_LIQFO